MTIPGGVTEISWRAFYKCTALKSVTIPSSVKTIDKSAFDGCPCEEQVKRDHPYLFK